MGGVGPDCLRIAAVRPGYPVPRRSAMPKRAVRIVKHLGTVPCVAACTACGKQFTVSLSTLKRVKDAQADLQQQFDRHRCEGEQLRGDNSSDGSLPNTDGC